MYHYIGHMHDTNCFPTFEWLVINQQRDLEFNVLISLATNIHHGTKSLTSIKKVNKEKFITDQIIALYG